MPHFLTRREMIYFTILFAFLSSKKSIRNVSQANFVPLKKSSFQPTFALMTDHLSPKMRSWNMSQVKSRNTQPELLVRERAHALGFRFRLHRTDLPGSPDLVFPRYRLALFVHGCFWHRHKGCVLASLPRDKRVARAIRNAGWHVGVIWQCQTSNRAQVERRLLKLIGVCEKKGI